MGSYGYEAQLRIYSNMFQGQGYSVPLAWEQWRDLAKAKLPAGPFGYLEGSAGSEETMEDNRFAFSRYKIRPRMLRDVSETALGVELFGEKYPLPFLLAPIGVQSIIHADAERAPAKAAATSHVPFILSTVSSVSIEEIAAEMGDAPRWFQLYPGKDAELVSSMVRRAEENGYTALVVTVDTTMLGWRQADLKNAYLPFLKGEGIANFMTDPVFQARLKRLPSQSPEAAIQEFLRVYVNPSFTWKDLQSIRNQTKLPLLIKGITHPEDARKALDVGADGVIVSNHGGRQVDGAISALDALVEIRSVLGPQATVLMDSGIRTAADILKAKALGANAVLIGRPYAYAMAVGGEAGITQWLGHMTAELDLELALSGYAVLSDIDGSFVTKVR